MPKSSTDLTSPAPKNCCQSRFTVTRERAEALLFTEGYIWTELQFGIRRGTAPIKSEEDLRGKTISVNKGTPYENWVTAKSAKRIKLLMVWHAHFLSLACQQSLRRWMETKSYRARVWFHVEYVNNIQSAIQSRCIVKHIRCPPVNVTPALDGDCTETLNVWKRIQSFQGLKE